MSVDTIMELNLRAGREVYGDKIGLIDEPVQNASGIDSRTLMIEVSSAGLELISWSTFMTNGEHSLNVAFMTEKRNKEHVEPIMRHVISTFTWKRD